MNGRKTIGGPIGCTRVLLAAAGAAALLALADAVPVRAQMTLMEDGTLFDPEWFRSQYPAVRGAMKLASAEADEEDDLADSSGEEAAANSEGEKVGGTSERALRMQEAAGRDTAAATGDDDSGNAKSTTAPAESRESEKGAPVAEYETVETESLSATELYRLYQLYGQRDGLSPYDQSSVNKTLLREMKKSSAAVIRKKTGKLGPSYAVISSKIYDTDSVRIWDTEYLISDQTNEKLTDILEELESKGYEIGFVLVDIQTGDAISYHAGARIYSASVIKAPYIFSLLENNIAPTNDMYLTGHLSDNDAYQRIRRSYGNDVFTKWIEGTGIPKVQSLTRYIMTTPLDLCRMFYKGTALLLGEEEYSEWARDTFTDSLNSAVALTVGTQDDKTVYSKAGWIASDYDDTDNCYTNGAVVDGTYPYVVAIMCSSPGYIGLEYAKDLMPILDEIHDEMVDPKKADSDTSTASEITDFARDAQSATQG